MLLGELGRIVQSRKLCIAKERVARLSCLTLYVSVDV